MVRRIVMIVIAIVVFAGVAPANARDDVANRNKAAVREALAQLSSGNVEGFFQLYADNFQSNLDDATSYDTTPADEAPFTNALVAAIPNLHVVPKVIIAQGDRVAVELSFSGTFSQQFYYAPLVSSPLPPTNQHVLWTELHFLHFNAEGKVIEDWVVSDPATMYTQIGTIVPDVASQQDTPLTSPVGHQLLNADALAVSYTSGRENETVALFRQQFDPIGASADTTSYDSGLNVSWDGGIPFAADARADLHFLQALKVAMPNLTASPEIVVAQGDWVAGLVTVTGTFTNELNLAGQGTIPPTGRSMVWQIGIINRYDTHGEVVEEWTETNPSPMLLGLGLVGPMERGE